MMRELVVELANLDTIVSSELLEKDVPHSLKLKQWHIMVHAGCIDE